MSAAEHLPAGVAEELADVLSSDGPPRRQLRSRPASEVTPERPSWLWERWLPAGELSLLVGRQGAGKTTWAAHVVAQLTSGRPLPGDEPRDPISVGHLSLEEPDGRVVARLDAAGADRARVTLLGSVDDFDDDGNPFPRPWRLPGDCALLAEQIVAKRLGLVVVDGLGYSASGDSHNYGNVGAALSALAGVAQQTGCAVVGLTHPPKGSSDPTTAAIGSTAWTAVPRLVVVLGREPDDEDRRVVRVSKTNFAEPSSGWSWSIGSNDALEVGYVTAVSVSDVAAEALVAAPETAEERGALGEAIDWLRDRLDSGGVGASQVIAEARKAGHSERTVRRAKTTLRVVSVKTGLTGGWAWQLPTDQGGQPPPEDGHSPQIGQRQKPGHLRPASTSNPPDEDGWRQLFDPDEVA